MTTTTSAPAATYRIRYNRTAIHIEGLESAGNYGPNAGADLGEGYVRYAPQSHCPALTRHAVHMAYHTTSVTTPLGNGRVRHSSVAVEYTTAAEALAAAVQRNRIHGGKVCAKCQARAEEVAATEAPVVTAEERAALVAEAADLRARLAEIDALLA